jgi:hypothetical protein
MTPFLIQNSLVTFLEDHAGELVVDSPSGTGRSPRIFAEALPPAKRDEDVYPFILVRWIEGEDPEDFGDSVETFSLIIGAYGEVDDERHAAGVAGQWLLVVVTRLRRLLSEHRILANRYELQFPLQSKKPAPDKQQNRYVLATITTRWSAPAPSQSLEA